MSHQEEYDTDIKAGRDYIENKYYKVIAEKVMEP